VQKSASDRAAQKVHYTGAARAGWSADLDDGPSRAEAADVARYVGGRGLPQGHTLAPLYGGLSIHGCLKNSTVGLVTWGMIMHGRHKALVIRTVGEGVVD
jgi:hypothetical protein